MSTAEGVNTELEALETSKSQTKTHKEDPILYLSEAAAQLGKTTRTIQNWINDGLLQAMRHPNASGRIAGVRQSEVHRLLKHMESLGKE